MSNKKFRFSGNLPFPAGTGRAPGRIEQGVFVNVSGDFDIVKFVWALHDRAKDLLEEVKQDKDINPIVNLTAATVLANIGVAVTAAIAGSDHERGQGHTVEAREPGHGGD